MTVEHLARTDPIAATSGATISRVASLMADENVGSVIIQEEDRPVGIVTDRDITVEVTAEGLDPTEVTASDVMNPDPVTVERGTGMYELTEVMAEHTVRRMPVVEDGDLYGIVTFDDLDQLLSDERRNLSDVVRAESPPY